MSEASRLLQQALKLEQQDDLVFSGPDDGFVLPNPYGGRLLGQAVSAAGQTIDNDRGLHSMHAYFMRTGKRDLPIEYRVQTLRDGGNFSSRRVEAIQNDKVLFSCVCGYHTFEANLDEQLARMPNAPTPESLESNEPWREVAHYEHSAKANPLHPIRSFDLRFVLDDEEQAMQARPDKRQIWVRYVGDEDSARGQESLFAWFSDFFLLPTVLKPLGVDLVHRELRIASLDHALWIHRPLDLRQWLLFDYRCTTYAHSRAHTEAKIYNQQGVLVASLVQEGLVQINETAAQKPRPV